MNEELIENFKNNNIGRKYAFLHTRFLFLEPINIDQIYNKYNTNYIIYIILNSK